MWQSNLTQSFFFSLFSDALHLGELFGGFKFKVERLLTPKLMVSHTLEMGGHHPKDEGAGAKMSMLKGPPPTHDPSAYEFGIRYVPGKPGSTLSATVRSDSFMAVGFDWKVKPWLNVHFAGQFFGNNAASFLVIDMKGKRSSTMVKMVQQTNFEVSHAHHLTSRLSAGMGLLYDSQSHWTSSSMLIRYLTRVTAGPYGSILPTEIVTLEVGTLKSREQELALPRPGWGRVETLSKQIGLLKATWWTQLFDNYRLTGAVKLEKEAEKRWRSGVNLGLEFATPMAVYKGVVDPFNFEVASEVREEILPGVQWIMCAKANFWESTYRFGAGMTFNT